MNFIKGCILLVLSIFIFALFSISLEVKDFKVTLVCAIMGSILIINGLIIISV